MLTRPWISSAQQRVANGVSCEVGGRLTFWLPVQQAAMLLPQASLMGTPPPATIITHQFGVWTLRSGIHRRTGNGQLRAAAAEDAAEQAAEQAAVVSVAFGVAAGDGLAVAAHLHGIADRQVVVTRGGGAGAEELGSCERGGCESEEGDGLGIHFCGVWEASVRRTG